MNGASSSTAPGALIGRRPGPCLYSYGGPGLQTNTASGADPRLTEDAALALYALLRDGRGAIGR